jgi:hypothetical protein
MERYSHTTVTIDRTSRIQRVVAACLAVLVGLPFCTLFALGLWVELKDKSGIDLLNLIAAFIGPRLP